MSHNYDVIIRYGYEVRAKDEEEAKRKAKREHLEEIGETGITRAVIDVQQLNE